MRTAAVFAALFAGALTLPAQEKKDEKKDAKKDAKVDSAAQKAAAVANLKKAEIAATITETDHFLIATTLPEAKAKALGTAMDKVVPVARKALKFEETETPWKGKLTVYVFPQGREFKNFIRSVVMRDPSGLYTDIRSDEPFVVDPVDVPAKATDADMNAASAAVAAGAYLKARGGSASVPNWFADAFGRVTAMRAEGTNGKRYQAYKTAARAAVTRPANGKLALSDLWAEAKPENADVLANSFAEYVAYGPGSMKLLDLIYGFRPNENGDVPGVPAALEAAGWKDWAVLEKAWVKWVTTGK